MVLDVSKFSNQYLYANSFIVHEQGKVSQRVTLYDDGSGGGGGSGSGTSTPTADYKVGGTFKTTTSLTSNILPYTPNNSQIKYIQVTPATGDTYLLSNGSNGISMTISGNDITVAGADSTFASGDVYEIGYSANYNQLQTIDSTTNSQLTSNLNPVWSRYTDAETIVTAQDLTASYADFGSEIDMRGYTHLRVGIVLDVNDSENITMKLLGLNESGGTDEFEIEGGLTQAIANTADGKYSYEFDVKGSPFVQIQAIAGTVGATAGDLTLTISKIWK